MYLKQLDVVGFKSFANRKNIEFVPGVTAIVGPNGSGKSNISDAIRWVLGEQSAKSIRGTKMEDIIFAGSDAKSALNVAEVTLTLDNQDQYMPLDYKEISVTRRVYRSGDSEYLLNKQPCRLKDIVDLFMDSGLGREAYSVIGQGKIDEILNSKSEEKRKIFEEAAGVLKYKTRKQKAEKKLDDTEDNLNRVEDILHELEGQVEPLKEQAAIAKDYLEKKEDLEKTEVAFIVHEIEDYHEKWEALSKTVEQFKEEAFTLSANINEEEGAIEKTRSDMQTLDESINELQEVLLLASEELEKLEGKKQVLKERKKNAAQNRDILKKRIASYEEHGEEIEKDISSKQFTYKEQQEKLKKLKDALNDEMKKFDAMEQNIEVELERLKSEYIEILNEQATFKNEIRYLQEQEVQLKTKDDRLDKDHTGFIQQRDDIERQKEALQQRLKETQQHIQSLQNNYQQLQVTIKNDTEEMQKKDEKLQQAYQFLQQARSRKEVLEEMQDDYTGFFQGVKEVLKRKKDIPGIQGAVAELITVPKQYETALETALGGAMQHVVVEQEEQARKAIQFLKKNKVGRATFLPMSVMKPRFIANRDLQSIHSHQAFVGVGDDLVSYKENYQNVIANLLGHVVIAKDLRGANELARLLKFRNRIVTLEGDVVNPGGSMSGGSRKQQNQSLLGRKRELENLNDKLKEMEQQTAELKDERKSLKDSLQKRQFHLDELRQEGEAARLEDQKRQSELREIEIEEKNLNDRLTLYDREKGSFQEEQASIKQRIQDLEEKLKTISRTQKELDKDIKALTEKKQQQQQSKESTQSNITDFKVKVAEQQQYAAHIEDAIEQMETAQRENEQQLKTAQEEFWLLEEEMNNDFSGEERLETNIEQKRREKEAAAASINRRREERLQIHQHVEDREREVKEIKRTQKQLTQQLHEKEVKHNRLDVELDNRLATLQEDYELTYEAAKEKYTLTTEPDQARTEVKLIKRAIDELGTVNLGAIDEYERVSTRHQFLTEQRDDLQTAKQNLLDVIDEMDEEVVKRFEETFEQVRGHFQQIFTELFGGGRADLQLSNPEDLLNTGVDILAQPPGKKRQHLALLSGGERALTAIVLLFSILKVRPVPFCVLDEVEAALDEANVNRFAQYLKWFSQQTQFIVVTHRKGTMEEADVLYGVTMQESGISNLVSVKLEESKELVGS